MQSNLPGNQGQGQGQGHGHGPGGIFGKNQGQGDGSDGPNPPDADYGNYYGPGQGGENGIGHGVGGGGVYSIEYVGDGMCLDGSGNTFDFVGFPYSGTSDEPEGGIDLCNAIDEFAEYGVGVEIGISAVLCLFDRAG